MFFWPILIVGAMLFIAFANGANDNFKGVATLFGSGTTDYRKAVWWANHFGRLPIGESFARFCSPGL